MNEIYPSPLHEVLYNDEILCMQIMMFWDVMPHSSIDMCQCFRGICVRKGKPHIGNWRQEFMLLAGQCETMAVRDEKK